MSKSSDGGMYHGNGHIAYGNGVCPSCGQPEKIEFVPVAECEEQRIADGELLVHCVYCVCGSVYYAVYDYTSDYVGVEVIDPSDIKEGWEELLNYVRN